jgi:hypothetical protein
LAQQVKTKYVATISDDDMWSRYHIEEAMRCFNQHPSIHSYFGQAIVVENETCHPLRRYSGSFLQIPSSVDSELVDFRIWDRRETAINCLANTPLNVWAVVALADAHKSAVKTSFGDPDFCQYPSNDRLYIWRMSLQGDIAIGRNVSLFYREHLETVSTNNWRQDSQEFLASDLAVSKEIARQADEVEINTREEWQREYQFAINYGLLPERVDLWNPLIRHWLLDKHHIDKEISEPLMAWRFNETLRKYVYLFTPPIIPALLRKVRAKRFGLYLK